MHNILSSVRDQRERGFTLVELLVVILIIGILTAVAVPMFMNQRKEAASSTMQSDLKNAATQLQGSVVKTAGRYPSALPDYSQFSGENNVILMPAKSNKEQFCLMAKNESYPDISHYYGSNDGGMLPQGQICSDPVNGESFASQNASKKVLVVYRSDAAHVVTYWRNALQAQGYQNANITPRLAGQTNITEMRANDLVIFSSYAWGILPADGALAEQYANEGGKVIVEGNDTNATRIPGWVKSFSYQYSSDGPVGYYPLYNTALTPSFPYTFSTRAYNSDTWSCITELQGGMHPLAVAGGTNPETQNCITMFAGHTAGGGKVAWIIYAHNRYPTQEVTPAYAAASWISS